FTLIASLQELAFIKRKLLKHRTKPQSTNGGARGSKSITSPKSSTSTTSSSFLFSPQDSAKASKHKFFASYFLADEDFEEIELPPASGGGGGGSGSSPFDD